MATWKKVIYSGSNAHLNQVTASSFSGSTYFGSGAALTGIVATSASYASTASFYNISKSSVFTGSGSPSDPLDIGRNNANVGDLLRWNGSAWAPHTLYPSYSFVYLLTNQSRSTAAGSFGYIQQMTASLASSASYIIQPHYIASRSGSTSHGFTWMHGWALTGSFRNIMYSHNWGSVNSASYISEHQYPQTTNASFTRLSPYSIGETFNAKFFMRGGVIRIDTISTCSLHLTYRTYGNAGDMVFVYTGSMVEILRLS